MASVVMGHGSDNGSDYQDDGDEASECSDLSGISGEDNNNNDDEAQQGTSSVLPYKIITKEDISAHQARNACGAPLHRSLNSSSMRGILNRRCITRWE